MPFEELKHTADWCLKVWAGSLPQLFTEAARGMAVLSGMRLGEAEGGRRRLEFSASERESLLVSFLSELLYISEEEHLALEELEIQIEGNKLTAEGRGRQILGMDKAIKAVTYHNLEIREKPDGFEVEIVFDV